MADLALTNLFGGVYAGRRVLVTGHTGFKGSWLALWLHALGAQVYGLSLPAPTQPNHAALLQLPVTETLLDLRHAAALQDAVTAIAPEVVFHLAAQALVRASYQDPITTFGSNVMGLVHLLAALQHAPPRVLIHATTDKCYAPHHAGSGPHGAYTEDDRLGGHDPYSTSKACAELITECWRLSFQPTPTAFKLATARAGNVLGGGDWSPDRLVPDLVRAAQAGQACPIRHPHAIRPWQHVLEPLSGYLMLGQHLLTHPACADGSWNFGPAAHDHATVAQIIALVAQHWPGLDWHIDDRVHPHEAPQLRLDCSKAARELGWQPVWPVQTALERTIHWYRAWHATGMLQSHADLLQYVADARTAKQSWTQ